MLFKRQFNDPYQVSAECYSLEPVSSLLGIQSCRQKHIRSLCLHYLQKKKNGIIEKWLNKFFDEILSTYKTHVLKSVYSYI